MHERDLESRWWPPPPEVVAAARKGDLRVVTAIARAGIPKLVAFYLGLGLRRPDAEDLASETCEAMVRTLPGLRDPDRFEAWFWRIARSKFYDHLRRRRREPLASLDREEMHDDPSDAVVISDEHAEVRRAFATLRPHDRELLWMRDVVGLGYGDIAGRLRMREGAIRVAVMRARQRLEVALREHEPAAEAWPRSRRTAVPIRPIPAPAPGTWPSDRGAPDWSGSSAEG